MEEKKNNNHGGKREGSGRKPTGTTTPISLRINTELLQVLNARGIVKNSFINDAIKEKLQKDGYIR